MFLKYLILITLILLPLLVELDVFAIDAPSRISISSNKNNYEEGETIQLTVYVSQYDGSPTLKVEMSINEILIGVEDIHIWENGKYTFEFLAEGPFLDEEGVIIARSILKEATATTQFNFKPAPVEDSKPIIKKPTTVTEKPTTVTEIVRIASGSAILGCDNTNSCFSPNKIIIEKESQIKWISEEGSTHIIIGITTNDGFPSTFDSGLIVEDFVMNFDDPGIYSYYCTVHPWMQGEIIVETDISNSPSVDPEVILSKPNTTPSISEGYISQTPPKVNLKPEPPKINPDPIPSLPVVKNVSPLPPKLILEPIVRKGNVVTSSEDKPSPNNLGIFIVIGFFVVILLIIYKIKKSNKNYNYKEEKNRGEYQRNKKRSEDHHRQQQEERQRWEREKYNRQENKQKKQKREKQSTESNKTEFSITEALDILNVNQDAIPEMIKKAQREMTLKYHPDKHKSTIQRKHAEMMMKNINIAYETLQRANRV